jgi:formylmethanofuran dehydrogenase subunit E
MLLGYQAIPAEDLFCVRQIHLTSPLTEILSKSGKQTRCELCDEEIINGRELLNGGVTLGRSCAGEKYREVLEHASILGIRR